MSKNIQMGENTFVIPLDMVNRTVEDIAREAALRIIDVCDQVAKQRGINTKDDSEKLEKQENYNEKTSKYSENMEDRAD